jgi:hypothetical protein
MDRGVMVCFRVAVPILKNDQGVLTSSISNFNWVVNSLKIGETNAVNSEMRWDHGVTWLRPFNDLDTNWMVSPTNDVIYRSPLSQK